MNNASDVTENSRIKINRHQFTKKLKQRQKKIVTERKKTLEIDLYVSIIITM